MAKVAIIEKATKKIVHLYDDPSLDQPLSDGSLPKPNVGKFGGPWGNPALVDHVKVESAQPLDPFVTPDELVVKERQKLDDQGNPILDENGNPVMEFYLDGELTAVALDRRRNIKLDKIRKLREDYLRRVDVAINEVTLGLRTDGSAVAQFRDWLLAYTDQFKVATNGDPTLLDSFDPDVQFPQDADAKLTELALTLPK